MGKKGKGAGIRGNDKGTEGKASGKKDRGKEGQKAQNQPGQGDFGSMKIEGYVAERVAKA